MRLVEPRVSIIARTMADDTAIVEYLERIGAADFADNHISFDDGHDLVEFAGRMCYRSWQPGLNPNVTKVRTVQADYLENVLKQGHGSVLEHASWTFLLEDISRIVTHELVRHRVGVAISQESMRYVRLTDIPMWLPDWVQNARDLEEGIRAHLELEERFQEWMTDALGLNNPDLPFHAKKEATSFMRRFAPGGVATSMTWTCNARELRHVIELRTSTGAEEEIRIVFDAIAALMVHESPMLFGDFSKDMEGQWVPKYHA